MPKFKITPPGSKQSYTLPAESEADAVAQVQAFLASEAPTEFRSPAFVSPAPEALPAVQDEAGTGRAAAQAALIEAPGAVGGVIDAFHRYGGGRMRGRPGAHPGARRPAPTLEAPPVSASEMFERPGRRAMEAMTGKEYLPPAPGMPTVAADAARGLTLGAFGGVPGILGGGAGEMASRGLERAGIGGVGSGVGGAVVDLGVSMLTPGAGLSRLARRVAMPGGKAARKVEEIGLDLGPQGGEEAVTGLRGIHEAMEAAEKPLYRELNEGGAYANLPGPVKPLVRAGTEARMNLELRGDIPKIVETTSRGKLGRGMKRTSEIPLRRLRNINESVNATIRDISAKGGSASTIRELNKIRDAVTETFEEVATLSGDPNVLSTIEAAHAATRAKHAAFPAKSQLYKKVIAPADASDVEVAKSLRSILSKPTEARLAVDALRDNPEALAGLQRAAFEELSSGGSVRGFLKKLRDNKEALTHVLGEKSVDALRRAMSNASGSPGMSSRMNGLLRDVLRPGAISIMGYMKGAAASSATQSVVRAMATRFSKGRADVLAMNALTDTDFMALLMRDRYDVSDILRLEKAMVRRGILESEEE